MNKNVLILLLVLLSIAYSQLTGFVNIAIDDPVTVSGTYSSAYPKNYAVDGDYSTAWGSSIDSTAQWLYVNLGKKQTVNGVLITWYNQYFALNYSLYYSDDAQNWHRIATVTDGNGGLDQHMLTVDCQYIGIFCREKNSIAYGILEFEVLKDETWNWQHPYPAGQLLSDVQLIGDSGTGYAVGEAGTIVHTTDGGNTWYPQSSGTTNRLNGVCFTDSDNGWVVGFEYTILHTSNGGMTWEEQPASFGDRSSIPVIDPNFPSDNSPREENNSRISTVGYNSVSFTDNMNGWAVGFDGYYGHVFHTSNGGENWDRQVLVTQVILYSVCFINDQKGWASGCFYGGGGNVIISTEDGGISWDIVINPSSTLFPLASIHFVDSLHGWVSGGDHGQFLRTQDGGYTWDEMQVGFDVELNGLQFIDLNHGWVTGVDNATGEGVVLRTSNSGDSWAIAQTDAKYALGTVFFANKYYGLAVGFSGKIVASNNGGATWTSQDSRETYESLLDVDFLSKNSGWAVGSNGTILHTSNGGTDWDVQKCCTTSSFLSVCIPDSGVGYAVGSQGIIYKTVNGGLNWDWSPSPTQNELTSVYFHNTQLGWIVGWSGTVFRTGNGGHNWASVPCSTNVILKDIHFTDANNGWIVGHNGLIKHTSDGGYNWYTQVSGTDYHLTSVYFTDYNHGWVAGYHVTPPPNPQQKYSVILRTENGGDDWEIVPGTNYNTLLNGIHFTDNNNGIAVGQKGTVLESKDGGKTWARTTIGNDLTESQIHLNDVFFTDDLNGWVVGNNGSILKYGE